MAGKTASLAVNIVADATKARAGFKQAEDAGKAMADALAMATGKVETAMGDTVKIADRLATALGPGFSRTRIDEIAADFQNAGLKVEDVDRNIGALTDELRRMQSLADRATADVATGMGKVADNTDRSRSVMANFTGNAMQDLPGVAGAFGPLNMAIGQFGEYAAEGNIKLAGLAAQAGPMLGIGAAIWYANNQLDLMAKKDAFRSDRVKAYGDLMDDAGDAAANLADQIREVGKVEMTTFANAGNPFADATVDVTGALVAAGLTVDQYATLVEGGTEAIKGWVAAQHAAGNSVPLEVWKALGEDAEDYATAVELAAVSTKFFGESAEQESARIARESDILSHSIEYQTSAWEKLWGALEKMPTAKVNLGALVGLTRVDAGVGTGVDGSIAARTNTTIPAGAAGGSGPAQPIIVNLPAGANGDDVVAALERWTRRNGALPIPVTSAVRV